MTDDDGLPRFARDGVNLASPMLGSEALTASDEFFGARERLLSDAPAAFVPDKYDDHGKWMDGWETRRRRDAGHDWCIVRLGVTGLVRGVDIDTSHFTGNYPPAASLEACLSDGPPDDGTRWTEIVPPVPLGPSARHFHQTIDPGPWNALRLNILPDGGVARLRVYGDVVPSWNTADPSATVELSALGNGGRILGYNDAHYGSVWALLGPGRGRNMGDGWETRRRREPGNDWIVIALGAAGIVERIEVDTAHFKGNYPDSCSVCAARVETGTRASIITGSMFWDELLPPCKLGADSIHTFGTEALADLGPVSHVRLNIFPDGGVSRFRVFGRLAP